MESQKTSNNNYDSSSSTNDNDDYSEAEKRRRRIFKNRTRLVIFKQEKRHLIFIVYE